MKKFFIALSFLFLTENIVAQGNFSGDLMTNVNFFNRDTSIGASGNPLYDNYLSGGESWLSLRYSQNGFTGTVRFDGFQNSNLLNPTSAYTGAGLGMFSLSKEYKGLTVTAGHIYDQIGSGILFRAYEDRGLLIDNAVFGLQLKVKMAENINMRAFTGQIRKQFERYAPIVKGINFEADYSLGKNVNMTSGFGALNRTMDQSSMDAVVATINGYDSTKRFTPKYNTYGATFYNTMNAGNFTWYAEAAIKSEEAIKDVQQNMINASGNVLYTTLGFSKGKIGINASVKRTENFVMRTSPNEVLIRGLYNWQPIIANIRPQRLIARYSPQSQDVSEFAQTVNLFYTPNETKSFNLSYTHIDDLNQTKLYREIWGEFEYRGWEKWIAHIGAQYLEYNQELYQIKPGVPMFKSITPFLELTYKITETQSIRTDLQWMSTKQDYGAWVYALIEYNIAPRWSFAIADMYNYAPSGKHGDDKQHYPNLFVAYNKDAHRFTAQYVKQVEGINCTGGVCRFEPAFSGFKFGLTSTF
ncbi:MAG: hypothetical protein KA275_05435 [Chitinophagaceae bacterium]|nr:hypothetical protein [Chitinophagaceae bacterium]